MRKEAWLPVLAATALLGGCGGGGGSGPSVQPAPAPPPAPPSGPTSIHDLKRDQSFTALTASSSVSLAVSNAVASEGSALNGTLTVSYNAAAKSYTVTAPGRSQTFTPTDIQQPIEDYQAVYRKGDGATLDILTLVTIPYHAYAPTRHVKMGYWQQNTHSNGQQDMLFDVFVFGFDTPASNVPRTGTASFDIDVFGLTTTPGEEGMTFQGEGRFDADFLTGIFSTDTYLTETNLSSEGGAGGHIKLTGAGKLSSTDNKFSGNIWYDGSDVDMAGTIAGGFFGPSASELGASFSASNANGSTVVGAMVGWRDQSNSPINLTLTDLITEQDFRSGAAELSINTFKDGSYEDIYNNGNSSARLTLRTDGTFDFTGSSVYLWQFSDSFLVKGNNPNFTSYETAVDGQPLRLDLYKPGRGNTELQLTYASFGHWSTSTSDHITSQTYQGFFAYGLKTPDGVLSARTGSARYEGVVYGAGASHQSRERYDVSGTSYFDVDFSNQRLAGALALTGTTRGGTKVDFGRYGFGGELVSWSSGTNVPITRDGQVHGNLAVQFYGPTGEEIGGSFHLNTVAGGSGVGTEISGVTVAKRQ